MPRMHAKTTIALDRAWARWKGSFPSFMARLDRDQIPYLSHSKVSLFERCPCCYYRQYVLGEHDESLAMRLGSLFHEAARSLYTARSKVAWRDLLGRLKTRGLDTKCHRKLRNAVNLLCQNRWLDHAIIAVEKPFFIDLAPGLPPVIGVADLILRDEETLRVVDHKTSVKFNDIPSDQLVLYAEHARRTFGARRIDGFYDEYRLVTNLSTILKPAFRRTRVSVWRRLLPPLVRRYRAAWKQIATFDEEGEPAPAHDCWKCNSSSGGWR